jgi:hypothetical protein
LEVADLAKEYAHGKQDKKRTWCNKRYNERFQSEYETKNDVASCMFIVDSIENLAISRGSNIAASQVKRPLSRLLTPFITADESC